MKPGLHLPEDRLNEWLDQATYADLLYLAKACRKRLEDALHEEMRADNEHLYRRLCHEYERVFTPVLPW